LARAKAGLARGARVDEISSAESSVVGSERVWGASLVSLAATTRRQLQDGLTPHQMTVVRRKAL